jgi:transposase
MKKSSKKGAVKVEQGLAKYASIGVDVSDRKSCWVGLTEEGELAGRGEVLTRSAELKAWAMTMAPTVIALEAGPQSPWMSRLVTACGHEVIVGNPAKIPSISRSRSKGDWRDAEQLARLARFDRKMLHGIQHRSEEAQRDLQVIRSRHAGVEARSKLVNHVRSTVKAHGESVQRCSTVAFVDRARKQISAELVDIVAPILEVIEKLTETIHEYDKRIERLVHTKYGEASWLRQIKGVGALTALAYVLVIHDASRFRSSRMVGPYLGLTPARDQSGESDPQKGISKEGDRILRTLLVQSAHYILGPFGVDSDLRRHGERIARSGGKNAKKRAAVAVARKLAVLLHHLWVSHDAYVPLFNANASTPIAA